MCFVVVVVVMFYIPLEHVVTSHNAFSVAASEALVSSTDF